MGQWRYSKLTVITWSNNKMIIGFFMLFFSAFPGNLQKDAEGHRGELKHTQLEDTFR